VSQDSPRIAELRRRVHADPASIAFAQLAEEYRRAGQYDEAVKYCRAGLARHPGYLSARVTLGRSLMELGELDDAAEEFNLVLRSAPDNLAAIRSIAEIHQRRGSMEAALEYYTRALALARFDPELEESVDRIAREIGRVGSAVPDGLSFEEASSEFLSAASRMPGGEADHADAHGEARSTTTGPASEPLIDFDALLASLGLPDATPPPVTERLIATSASVFGSAEPLLPETPVEPEAGDPFAALEHELRAFGERSTAAGRAAEKPPETRARIDRADALVVEELEAWLRVLRDDDAAGSPRV
jgi:tetratricopeptide (TPR) repeat protein